MSKEANAKAARLTATILRNLAAAKAVPKPAPKTEAEVFRGLVESEPALRALFEAKK